MSASDVVVVTRASSASASSWVSLPRPTARAVEDSRWARPRATASSSISRAITCRPLRAKTSTIPAPIVPKPTTPTVRNSRAIPRSSQTPPPTRCDAANDSQSPLEPVQDPLHQPRVRTTRPRRAVDDDRSALREIAHQHPGHPERDLQQRGDLGDRPRRRAQRGDGAVVGARGLGHARHRRDQRFDGEVDRGPRPAAGAHVGPDRDAADPGAVVPRDVRALLHRRRWLVFGYLRQRDGACGRLPPNRAPVSPIAGPGSASRVRRRWWRCPAGSRPPRARACSRRTGLR